MYVCGGCGDTVYLFGRDKGKQLSQMMEIPFLGSIPIDPMFSEAADSGVPVVNLHPESITAKAFTAIADTLRNQLPPKEVPEAPPEESRQCPGAGHHHHEHGEGCNHPHHHHRH
jgi:hypothetical protein